jgi:hypothetical protein
VEIDSKPFVAAACVKLGGALGMVTSAAGRIHGLWKYKLSDYQQKGAEYGVGNLDDHVDGRFAD